jgi:hypothetical protein
MMKYMIKNVRHVCQKQLWYRFMALSRHKHMSLCHTLRLCTCIRWEREVKKRGLTLTFLKEFFLSATFDLEWEALLERGSLEISQSTRCYVFILSNHIDKTETNRE